MDISLPEILVKYEQKKDAAIKEIVYTIGETFKAMEKEQTIGFRMGTDYLSCYSGPHHFQKETADGHRFIMKDHTAETRIYYALDLGTTYRLIDESMLESIGMTETEIMESALIPCKSVADCDEKG